MIGTTIYDTEATLAGMMQDRSRLALGALGERYAAILFRRAGYEVSHTHRDGRGDLLVYVAAGTKFKVEVKTARQNAEGRWRFCLYKSDKHGRTDYHDSDFVVLLAVTRSGHAVSFLIPTGDIDARTQITFTSNPRTYSGRWATYRTDKLTLEER